MYQNVIGRYMIHSQLLTEEKARLPKGKILQYTDKYMHNNDYFIPSFNFSIFESSTIPSSESSNHLL